MAAPSGRLMATMLLTLVLLLVQSHALEFMGADDSALEHHDDVGGDSAELPANFHSYSRDTIANFNPHKQDAHFRTLWERVPLQKQDVIKRR
ncbi:uncharacterized protein LOC133847972 [Drosophila sulfurigaster albostrigata]|uniref:uncharacterized protein LOC133847972 n=1 Tax=Drosophila sulfurigaster albostrigata TaxID=89887 RepID=UPI002D21ED41|nr:uncharacterized protein LOC133847972 [Drosophila sulfurigaster albostrigata]